MNCPWSGFEPTTLNFCERPLCGWIAQPANSWSNLAYVAVGCWILRRNRRHPFGWMAVLVGLTSFFYHASLSFAGEFLDIGSMFLFSSILLVLNLKRAAVVREEARRARLAERSYPWLKLYLAINVASLGLLLIAKTSGIWNFGIQVTIAGLVEIWIAARTRAEAGYRDWWAALGLFGGSYAFWLLDFHRGWCRPDNHWLNGHALWHCLNSLCFLFLHRFYSQFERRK